MKITILGPGSWGLTVGWMLSGKADELCIWGLPQFVEPIQQNRNVEKPVKVTLQENILLSTDLEQATDGADLILFVVPSEAVRPVAQQLKKVNISSDAILVNLAKGFELPTLYRMSEVLEQEFSSNAIATLSGPTLAMEILEGKPTAAVIASKEEEVARYVQKALHRDDIFRLYTNKDLVGVELGGSLKNVIAIATGFAYALDLGHNTIGAIITRGLAEIVRISIKLNANPSTLYGLSGIGDLIATCNSPTSRNYRVGYALGKGQKMDDILSNLGAVAEGVRTTEAVIKLAEKHNISVPLSTEIYKLVQGKVTPKEAINNLMSRELKSEEFYHLSSMDK
jgi:glycerol-3-phosphate dehydrogenase (NAD(P)+)